MLICGNSFSFLDVLVMALVDSVREDMYSFNEGRVCIAGWAFAKTVSNDWETTSNLCDVEIKVLTVSDSLRVSLDCSITLA